MAETDREILIRVDAKMTALHEELIGAPGREGRIPKLENTQEEHAEAINKAAGASAALKWIVGGICLAILTLGSVLLAHVLGGR